MKEITVYKDYWSKKEMDGRLYDGEGFCLMGFIGGAFGLKREEMYNKTHLSQCFQVLPKELEWLFEDAKYEKLSFSTHQGFLMYINDSKMPDKKKLGLFEMILKGNGMKLKVIG